MNDFSGPGKCPECGEYGTHSDDCSMEREEMSGSSSNLSVVGAIVSEVFGLVLATVVLMGLEAEISEVPGILIVLLWQGISAGIMSLANRW